MIVLGYDILSRNLGILYQMLFIGQLYVNFEFIRYLILQFKLFDQKHLFIKFRAMFKFVSMKVALTSDLILDQNYKLMMEYFLSQVND